MNTSGSLPSRQINVDFLLLVATVPLNSASAGIWSKAPGWLLVAGNSGISGTLP